MVEKLTIGSCELFGGRSSTPRGAGLGASSRPHSLQRQGPLHLAHSCILAMKLSIWCSKTFLESADNRWQEMSLAMQGSPFFSVMDSKPSISSLLLPRAAGDCWGPPPPSLCPWLGAAPLRAANAVEREWASEPHDRGSTPGCRPSLLCDGEQVT